MMKLEFSKHQIREAQRQCLQFMVIIGQQETVIGFAVCMENVYVIQGV